MYRIEFEINGQKDVMYASSCEELHEIIEALNRFGCENIDISRYESEG